MASAVVATVDLYCHYWGSSLSVLDFFGSVDSERTQPAPQHLKKSNCSGDYSTTVALSGLSLFILHLFDHRFLLYFYLYEGEYKHKRAIKLISLFLIMIVFAIYQSQSLHELKSHYANYETGETWQKYGAL